MYLPEEAPLLVIPPTDIALVVVAPLPVTESKVSDSEDNLESSCVCILDVTPSK